MHLTIRLRCFDCDSLSPTLRPAVYFGVEGGSDIRFYDKVIHSPGSEIVS